MAGESVVEKSGGRQGLLLSGARPCLRGSGNVENAIGTLLEGGRLEPAVFSPLIHCLLRRWHDSVWSSKNGTVHGTDSVFIRSAV